MKIKINEKLEKRIIDDIKRFYSFYKNNLVCVFIGENNEDVKDAIFIFLQLRDKYKYISFFVNYSWYNNPTLPDEYNLKTDFETINGREMSDFDKALLRDCDYVFNEKEKKEIKKQLKKYSNEDFLYFYKNSIFIVKIDSSFIKTIEKVKGIKPIKELKVVKNPDTIFEDEKIYEYEEFSFYQSGTIKFNNESLKIARYIQTLLIIFIGRGGQQIPIDIIQDAFIEEELCSSKKRIQQYIYQLKQFIKEYTEDYEIKTFRGSDAYIFQKK